MIHTRCRCGEETDFGEVWAGVAVRCSGCGATLVVPRSGSREPPGRRESTARPGRPVRRGRRLHRPGSRRVPRGLAAVAVLDGVGAALLFLAGAVFGLLGATRDVPAAALSGALAIVVAYFLAVLIHEYLRMNRAALRIRMALAIFGMLGFPLGTVLGIRVLKVLRNVLTEPSGFRPESEPRPVDRHRPPVRRQAGPEILEAARG